MLSTRGLRPALGFLALSAMWIGCDEKPPPAAKPSPEPAAAAPAPAAPSATPDPLSGLTVDELGPFLRDRRVDMNAKDADTRLKAEVAKLPVTDKVVSLA